MSPSAALENKLPLRAPNPFLSSVTTLDQAPADVAEINADAFNKCLTLVNDVRDRGFTQALVLFGEPGSGKTHLLSRLRATLEKESSLDLESLFIPIRMVTHPRMLWRFLRQHTARALLRQKSFARVIKRQPEEIAEEDRNLAIIFGNLANGTNYADSAAWLRGDELPEDVLKSLGFSPSGDDVEQEAASRTVVTNLCNLAAPVPFVFCFDQLEGLQSHTDDREGYFKFGQTMSDLHDITHNVAMIACLQTAVVNEFGAAIREADRDRLLERRAGLRPLDLAQAMKLVNARLDSVPQLKGQRPIAENDLKPLFKDGFCVPRKVIVHCQHLLDRPAEETEVGAPAMDMEREYRNLLRTPLVKDAAGILKVALPSVMHVKGIHLTPPKRPDSSLEGMLSGKTPSATAICNQQAGTPLLKQLDKARSDWQSSGAPRLVILRDARNGISMTAKKSREALAQIEKEGARIVSVKPEALAALDAISRLLANARSGDLTHRGDTVPVDSVEKWLRSDMPRAVDELLDEIGGEKVSARDDLAGMLMDLLSKVKIIPIEAAAAQLGQTAAAVADCARRNPSLVGLAGGSNPVLFRIVERPRD